VRKLLIINLLVAVVCMCACTTKTQQNASRDSKELPTGHHLPDTLSLVFAGDVMGHTPQIESARTGTNTFDYNHCFDFVAPVIKTFDIAVANLEVSLPGAPPYHGYPMFKSPDALAGALQNAGFDLIVTANNHCADSKRQGILGTIDCLDSLGLMRTGTFKHAKDLAKHNPLLMYRKGMSLAFLNYTFGTNGMVTPPGTFINRVDEAQIKQDLAAVRTVKPDFTIVVMHWGTENEVEERVEQRVQAEMLLKNGADIVIGAHPHVVQPIKKQSTTLASGKTKTGYVVYSLGNFISAQTTPETSGGALFAVHLTRDSMHAPVLVARTGFIPIWRYLEGAGGASPHFYVIPDTKLARKKVPETMHPEMLSYFARIRKRLNNVPEMVFD
jgi:poly-gamma-glutamate capsule biosynthesis protein CapA/YwtB (metallophosphatase superfamily)